MSVSLRPLLKAFLHFGVVTSEAAPVYSAAAFCSVLPQTHHKRLSHAPVLPINSEREGYKRPAANCYCFPEILGGRGGRVQIAFCCNVLSDEKFSQRSEGARDREENRRRRITRTPRRWTHFNLMEVIRCVRVCMCVWVCINCIQSVFWQRWNTSF